MTISGHQRVTIVLSIVCVALLALVTALIIHFLPLEMRVMMARGQIQLFDEMRERALQASASGIADSMRYVVGYYPSGTKQIAGSQLDQIVEQARAATIRECLDHLRKTTGEDLGDAAEPWIKKYGSQK